MASNGSHARKRAALGSVLIVLLTLAAYVPALRGGFIWDDGDYVTGNATLRDLSGLRRIWLEVGAVPQYYPLVHTSYWLEYHVWGLHPFGYHLINVLLHALAAVLFGRVLMRLQAPGAWLAAVLFALHPVSVESVAWITERKNVLSAVFYFAAALAYLRFAPPGLAGGGPGGRRRWFWYAGALALFVAALLSKTVTCSLPAALLLAGWWKQGRLAWRDVLPLTPFFVVGASLGLLTIWIEKHHIGAQGSEWSLTPVERCLVAGRALWFYAAKLAWPARLTFIYPRWAIHAGVWWQWLFPAAALGAGTALWLARRRIGRGPLVAVLFFAGTLGPALGFVNVYPMRYSFVADHFQYLAAAGLIALGAAGLARVPRVVQGALLLVLGLLTWHQSLVYRNLETLWRDTLAKNPDCWLAHNNLGLELERTGRFDEAFNQYLEARRIEPDYAETYNNLGNAYVRKGQFNEATGNYRRAVELNPRFVAALNSLGVLLAMQGKSDEAVPLFRQALRVNPNDARTHTNLGNALELQNDWFAAIREYGEALRIAPDDAVTHKNLGIALEEKGFLAEAISHFEESLRIDSNDPATQFQLGRALARNGQREPAVAHLTEALRLKPDYEEAKQLLSGLGGRVPQ